MAKPIVRSRQAFTLVELMIAILVMGILMMAVAVALADGHRGWQQLYNRANKGIRVDAILARAAFESTVRKSTEHCDVASDGSYAQLYYYHNPMLSTRVDGYTRFYIQDGQFKANLGNINSSWVPIDVTSIMVLANDVQSGSFERIGNSLRMILVLNDGKRQLTVVSSAVRSNK